MLDGDNSDITFLIAPRAVSCVFGFVGYTWLLCTPHVCMAMRVATDQEMRGSDHASCPSPRRGIFFSLSKKSSKSRRIACLSHAC